MGKQSGKNKKQAEESKMMQNKAVHGSPKAPDTDTAVFISTSQELKEEGNRLFQRRDHEGAMLKYEKAIKLLPRNHIDVSYLRSNMAACYMQMGLSEYPRAIHECNLALEVTPKYSKALLKRARCYEALNRLDLALRDAGTVLKMEPNNMMGSEISERVKKAIEEKGLRVNDTVVELPPEYVEPPGPPPKVAKEKKRKKKSGKVDEKKARDEIEGKKGRDEIDKKNAADEVEDKRVDSQIEEKKAEDKVVVEEKIRSENEEPKKTIKLIFGEDIRWAQLPLNCNLLQLREDIADRFPGSGEVLIKYRDFEGDLVTITTDEELKWAEASTESQGSARLYLIKGNAKQDLSFDILKEEVNKLKNKRKFASENGTMENGKLSENRSYCIDEWMVEFAKLFKNHVGLDSDAYLGLHELGMKVYSEAMEEAVTSEESKGLFDIAARKFQEMAAMALFNWGNTHMSRARKRVGFTEIASGKSLHERIKTTYDWTQKEYRKAGQKYEEALIIKPDFYEGLIALAQQQFEQAKLSWYYAIGNNIDLETWPSEDVLKLYNMAEDNMQRGMEMWEAFEAQHLNELSNPAKFKSQSHKDGLDGLFKDLSPKEATEQAKNMKSQINLLWGSILYERSIMEFKLDLPVWPECLEVAVEKFELAGASPTDIAVMIKNHVSNDNGLEGLGFRIDEIVQAWHDMHEAKNWQTGVPTFRLEPLFRRRVSELYHAMEIVFLPF